MKQELDKTLFADFSPVSTDDWEALIQKDLKGQDYEKKLIWRTLEGIGVRPYYREEDLTNLEHHMQVPGNVPFLRGTQDHNKWKVVVEIEGNDFAKCNSGAIENINKGADKVVFDVSLVNNKKDVARLFNGLDLKKTQFTFSKAKCNRFFRGLLEEYCQENKLDPELFTGNFEADIFTPLMLEGAFPEAEEQMFKRIHELVEKVQKSFPNLRSINVRGDIIHNSGAHAVQELAYALASGNEYLSLLTSRGLSSDVAAKHIQFTFGIGSNYFIEIAKLRAARMLWSKIVEQYKTENKDSMKMYIHAVTSTFNKSIYDPYTNMLRNTTEAMSAVIGGCNSLLIKPFDGVFDTPDAISRRVSRNLHMVLKEEAHFDKVIDPAAGSYYVENLTHEIAEKAWELFRETEANGGFLECFKKGSIQEDIENTVLERNKYVKQRRDNTVGTSIFPNSEEKIIDQLHKDVFDNDDNPSKKLKQIRKAEPFEKLRLATEKFERAGGKLPRVFLIPIGSPGMASARQIFSRNFFACSGFDVVENIRFSDSDKAASTALKNEADMVVICSSDEDYDKYAREITGIIKNKNKNVIIIVAGNPVEIKESLEKEGVDGFIHVKTSILDTLEKYQKHFRII